MQYFEAGLPWQKTVWERLTTQYPNIPHAMLFSGIKGTGKQHFIARFTAWLLCQNKEKSISVPENRVACGECESCNWLRANTHPQYLHVTVAADSKSNTIKVDDVRNILPFAQKSSSGVRVIFIEQAQHMNIAASNALLKTLEEPASNVVILLSSDQPQLLLPTIKSRVQVQDVSQVSLQEATDYVNNLASYQQALAKFGNLPKVEQLLTMVGGAPLMIASLLDNEWLMHRKTWLMVWQALRVGQRDALAASQYWQKNNVSLNAAIALHGLMCRDVLAIHSGITPVQEDLNFDVLKPLPTADAIDKMQAFMLMSMQAQKQNIQSAYLYDKLMHTMSLS